MAMGVDQTWQHRGAFAIMAEIKSGRQLVLFGEKLCHLTVLTDQNGVETDDLTLGIQRDAVYIFDKSVSKSRRCNRNGEQGA